MLREVEALVSAGGNVELAAERLDITPVELMSHVLKDGGDEDFARAIRTAVALNVIDILAHLRIAMQVRADELSGSEMSKLLEAILTGLSSLFPAAKAPETRAPSLMQIFNNPGSNDVKEQLTSRIDRMSSSRVPEEDVVESERV